MNATPLSGGLNAAGGAFPPIVSNANVIYVSANGSDTYAGSNINYPKATLTAALAAAALNPYTTIVVLDSDWTEGSTPLNVPILTTIRFAGSFSGGLVLFERSVAEVPTHYSVAGLTEIVKISGNITSPEDFPCYRCGNIRLNGKDGTVVGADGIRVGGNSFAYADVGNSVINGGSLVINETGGGLTGSRFGITNAIGNDSVFITAEPGAAGSTFSLVSYYDNANQDCVFARFSGGTGIFHSINYGEIYLAGAGAILTDWLLADANEMNMIGASPPFPLPDYANGTLNGLWPTLIANTDTAGLVPVSPGTATVFLTDTNPVTFA